MDLNVIDLFSGIGGFSLGLHNADPRFKTIAFCEIDPFCQKVLQKNFPGIKIYDDIKKTTFTEPAFLVCGGFPCQSISVAGKQRGKDDDRWLFPQMLRVIKEVKPKWIIAENVQNLLNIADGEILQGIYNDLEALDYEVQTFRVSAASQGAWHKRERIWIVANSDTGLGIGENKEIQARRNTSDSSSSNVSDTDKGDAQARCERQRRVREESEGERISSDAPSLRETLSDSDSRLRGRRRTIEQSGENEVRRIYSSEKEQTRKNLRSKTVRCDAVSGKTENVSDSENSGLQGYKLQTDLEIGRQLSKNSPERSIKEQQNWWQTQSELRGVPDGISYGLDKDRSNRIKSLGNAIVPQIITEIGKAIIKAEFNDG